MPIDAEGAAVVPIPMFRKRFAIHAALAQNHYVDLRTQIPPMPIEDSPLLRWAKYRNHLNQSQLQYSITDPTVKPQSCGFKQETTHCGFILWRTSLDRSMEPPFRVP